MDDLELYAFQLADIENSLTLDPVNEDLLRLKKDIHEAIALLRELSGDTIPPTTSQKKTRLNESTEVTADEVPSENEVPVEELFSPPVDWCIGDVCFISDNSVNAKYIEAKIMGISADRSFYTIRLSSTNQIKVLQKDFIYRTIPKKLPVSNISKKPDTKKTSLTTTKSRSSSTYKEYIRKRESEHSQKADAWKSFKQKQANK